ncbi:hypothetical protein HK102_006446, partial [Quaeritorhiza haematococci]
MPSNQTFVYTNISPHRLRPHLKNLNADANSNASPNPAHPAAKAPPSTMLLHLQSPSDQGLHVITRSPCNEGSECERDVEIPFSHLDARWFGSTGSSSSGVGLLEETQSVLGEIESVPGSWLEEYAHATENSGNGGELMGSEGEKGIGKAYGAERFDEVMRRGGKIVDYKEFTTFGAYVRMADGCVEHYWNLNEDRITTHQASLSLDPNFHPGKETDISSGNSTPQTGISRQKSHISFEECIKHGGTIIHIRPHTFYSVSVQRPDRRVESFNRVSKNKFNRWVWRQQQQQQRSGGGATGLVIRSQHASARMSHAQVEQQRQQLEEQAPSSGEHHLEPLPTPPPSSMEELDSLLGHEFDINTMNNMAAFGSIFGGGDGVGPFPTSSAAASPTT